MSQQVIEEQLDERDAAILAQRVAALDAIEGPRVGDFVRFADGVERRISYIWSWSVDDENTRSVQTSDGGSYYLGNGYVSMSGALHPGVPESMLTATGETREGAVWFFRHNQWRAHNGVDVTIPFRVFACSRDANR